MLSLSLGPLALPVAPLLLGAALWAASAVARALARRAAAAAVAGAPATGPASHEVAAAAAAGTGPAAGVGVDLVRQAGDAVWTAAWVGLLAARAGHLLGQADLYLATLAAPADWLALVDLRDGGLHQGAGLAAGLGWLAWRAQRQPRLRRPLAGAAAAGLALWLGAGAALQRGQPDRLPDLSVLPLDGGPPQTLAAAAAGRPVVLNLWASWCGPCRQEMPLLAAAQRREPGVALLLVNQGESPAAIRAYLATLATPPAVLRDPDSRLGPAVGSRGLPTTLFYDAAGRRVDAHFGMLSGPALAARLRTLRGPVATAAQPSSPPLAHPPAPLPR